jgi:hypothetical protein
MKRWNGFILLRIWLVVGEERLDHMSDSRKSLLREVT